MRLGGVFVAAVLVFSILTVLPSSAEAGIPIPINTGEDIFEVGELPEPFASDGSLPAGAKAGYKCDIFGILWAYITISGCQPVAFLDDTFSDEPELVAAISAKYSEDDMKIGVWTKHGRWLFLLAIIGGIAVAVLGRGDDDDAEAPADDDESNA